LLKKILQHVSDTAFPEVNKQSNEKAIPDKTPDLHLDATRYLSDQTSPT